MFFNPMLYITFKQKYRISKRNAIQFLRYIETIQDIMMHKSIIIIAVVGFICPLASGRFLLVGCNLSLFKSFKSFNIYTAEEIRQKQIRPKIPILIFGLLKIISPKKRGTKINKFFM